MSRSGYDARVMQGPDLFALDAVTLVVRDNDRRAFLMHDGTWTVLEDGTTSDDIGIVLPAGAIEAIAIAIAEHQGHTSHADTEARVLREWLTVERGRVDAALAARKEQR